MNIFSGFHFGDAKADVAFLVLDYIKELWRELRMGKRRETLSGSFLLKNFSFLILYMEDISYIFFGVTYDQL